MATAIKIHVTSSRTFQTFCITAGAIGCSGLLEYVVTDVRGSRNLSLATERKRASSFSVLSRM